MWLYLCSLAEQMRLFCLLPWCLQPNPGHTYQPFPSTRALWTLKAHHASLFRQLRSAAAIPFKHRNTKLLSDDSFEPMGLRLLHLQKKYPSALFQFLPSLYSVQCLLQALLPLGFHPVNAIWLLPALAQHKAMPWLAWGQDSLSVFGQCWALTFSWWHDINNMCQKMSSLGVSLDCGQIATAQD